MVRVFCSYCVQTLRMKSFDYFLNFIVDFKVDLEKDRAELLTRCTLAEQQVAEYEEYIDTYVRR